MNDNQTTDILASIKKTVLSYYEYKESEFLLHKGKKTNIITLTEDDKKAKCREIKFEITGEILIYKFDKQDKQAKEKHPLSFLEAEAPLRSLVDYIIFYHKDTNKGNKKLYVIICNLKSEKAGNMDDQMLSGSILADFICKTAVRCHNSWNNSINNNNKISLENLNIISKEIAVYSKIPSQEGKSKPQKNLSPRTILKCNNKIAYKLDDKLPK